MTAVREAVTDRVAAVLPAIAEHAARHDAEASFPAEALAELRRSGLLALHLPAADGGLGGGIADMVSAGERLGRADLSAALVFVMHCQQVVTLARYAGPRLREHLFPRLARGEIYLASVTTEAGSGGQLTTAESELAGGGGSLGVDRLAPVVTGGAHADGFLITMRAPHAPSPSAVSLVYADRGQLEVAPRGRWNPMGMRATDSPPLRLTGTVPDWQTVGGHGRFREMAVALFAPMAHLGWAAAWLGAATGALGRTVAHLRDPATRRGTDLSSELLLTRLAGVRGRLERTNALLWHAVDAVGDADDVSAPAVQSLLNTLKVSAAEDTFAALHELVELTGLRHGYTRDSPLWLERTFRDLRSASLNYANDRLRLANGRLALLDPEVHLA